MDIPDTSGSVKKDASQRLDAQGFAVRFRSAFRSLRLLALAIVRDGALAEDVLQDAAIIALGKLDTFRADSNFNAWFGAIVRNVALNRARKERRKRLSPVDPNSLHTMQHEDDKQIDAGGNIINTQPKPDPDAALDASLRDALDGIPETARACLLLRTLEGWDYARISEVLEVPEGTAMSHVHRTRKRLRDLLDARSSADQTGAERSE